MASSSSEPKPRKRPRRGLVARWLRRLVVLAVLLAIGSGVAVALTLRHYERDLPSTAELRHYEPPQVTRVLARDGTMLAELFVERRTVVSITKIPTEMKVAVLAAEDADFYRHEGLDYLGMLRALWVNVRSGSKRQGASTITQQVVKNVLLSSERTFERKTRELLLARRIEQELSKDEILELYLNHIYFGHGRYGIEEASRYYFGKGVAEVTLAEAALLASLPKGPNIYSPRVDFDRAKRRRDRILGQVVAKGFASRKRVDQALAEPIVLAPATESMQELAPEAVDEVRRRLRSLVGKKAAKGGFTVTTTIDPERQAEARKAVRENLDAYAKRHGLIAPLEKRKRRPKGVAPFQGTPSASGHRIYQAVVTGADDKRAELHVRVGTVDGRVRLPDARRYNPKGLRASRFAEKGRLLRVSAVTDRGIGRDGVPREFRLELGPQSALVAVDVASREIVALVGSYEALRAGLDRTAFAKRQPGSTFKPFVYSYGIHTRKLTAATLIPPIDPKADPPPPPLLLREGLTRSINHAASWSLQEVGAPGVVAWARSMGIRSRMAPTASLALGAYEVTPRELAEAYGTFASGGTTQPLSLIAKIVGPDGREVPLAPRPSPRRILDPAESYLVNDLLQSVVKRGTGRRGYTRGLPLAGKTGTSNKAKDAWFAGFSPELVTVVWTGFDDTKPLGRGEQGATAALPAWAAFMRKAHAGRKVAPWPQPQGLKRVAIDPKTGLLPYADQEDTTEELFLEGTVPTEQSEAPDDGAGGGNGESPYDELDEGAGGGAPEPTPTPSAAPMASAEG